MKEIYLLDYSVAGIKNLDKQVSLSFYKKIIERHPDTRNYHIKGIYGMNGSGKSAIVTSVKVLKYLLINSSYLNDPLVQRNLDAMINKGSRELRLSAEFLFALEERLNQYHYEIVLVKNPLGEYIIQEEHLGVKNATSKADFQPVFDVTDHKISINAEKQQNTIASDLEDQTKNLLDKKTVSAVFIEKILWKEMQTEVQGDLITGLVALCVFGQSLFIYLDESDDHTEYVINDVLQQTESKNTDVFEQLRKSMITLNRHQLNMITDTSIAVKKTVWNDFMQTVRQLYEFLHIFKSDLTDIKIDRKEDKDVYICRLIMVYDQIQIDVEFESTGIRKLIRLFAFIREMVRGGIVFIDEFDSNLHDVYLCALIEYLIEYGEGQLCFTTHNVGPMDILKKGRKSIDFLSMDHMIYPWKTNGNYSPSKLYRNGMIEGSPFNVDSIDFIGIFDEDEEDS